VWKVSPTGMLGNPTARKTLAQFVYMICTNGLRFLRMR
jgi:hypothetical protein